MTRRSFLGLGLFGRKPVASYPEPCTEPAIWNRFIAAEKQYVDALNAGLLPVKQWEHVVDLSRQVFRIV